MARVTVEDCVEKVPNRFELVLYAAQRARNLARGEEITVGRDNDKNPVVALREIADETIPLAKLEQDLVKSLSRAPEPEPATPLGTEKVTYERMTEPARLYRDLEWCLSAVDDYLHALYPDNSFYPTPERRMDAVGALEDLEKIARELRADIEGR